MEMNIMKKNVIIFCTIVMISTIVQTQVPVTIYTPNGCLVTGGTYYYPEETTPSDIDHWNYRLSIEFPLANRIEEATTTCNRHAYAWHMTEGGTAMLPKYKKL
jgi:hypothetical protein